MQVDLSIVGMENVTITTFVDTYDMEHAYRVRNEGQEMPQALLRRNAFHAARKKLASDLRTKEDSNPLGGVKLFPVWSQ